MKPSARPVIVLGALALLGLPALAGTESPPPSRPAAERAAGLEPLPKEEWSLAHAAHLLRRAGFGGTLEEIRALHALGLEGAVDRLLAAQGAAGPAFEADVTGQPPRVLLRAMDAEERKMFTQEYRREDRRQLQALRAWWLERMVRTERPLEEKMTLFWHGHFCSGQSDVRNSYHMYLQNETLRRHALGSFRALTHAVAKDPAMLEYLDNNRNRKSSPNENFARELMELFTLGIGHYTEEDIKAAARAFTGWTFVGNTFYKAVLQHDDGRKSIFGKAGPYDGEDVIDTILARPECPRFIAGKLATFFAMDEPPADLVDGLARTLRESDLEVRPALRRLFLSRAFYSEAAMGQQIKSPVDLVVGLFRSLPTMKVPAQALPLLTARFGQNLFEPPNVKGWPGGRAWVSTSSLLDRYNLLSALVGPIDGQKLKSMGAPLRSLGNRKAVEGTRSRGEAPAMDPGDMEGEMQGSMEGEMQGEMQGEAPGGMEPERARRQRQRERRQARRGPLRLFDAKAYIGANRLDSAEAAVDHLTALLLVRPASKQDRAVLIEVVGEDFRASAPDAEARFERLLKTIISTPEFQLN